MHIQLTTLTQVKQHRQFSLYADKIELVFELIDIATRQGETIISINFSDPRGALHLPVETLDSPFQGNPFLQLEQQWKSILASPVGTESSKIKPATRQYEYLTITRQKQLYHFQQIQERIQQSLEKTQTRLTDGYRKKQLIALHQQSLRHCQQSIAHI